ncbi:hypothetical protein LJ655_17240 [Paraburkholderia sp. MMS20-SJTN17]|uniref:Uncharacterized protein n=1 Tax=Paraburkholderia translucens TaxID=2886945 RepID=A0ABS8KFZ6_9BURK|nr:hypothetical protein [Paraburkholderia sp. MMS20-SJTN17]MCC8403615.1 hypothetical protein [Paraburkholderia sp. MMS20-SJTN17]
MKMSLIADILAARGPTMVRISNILDYSNDLSLVLSKFGLTRDEAMLVAQDRAGAIAILTNLLWKGQAYDCEHMDRSKAKELAERIVAENESKDSKYFSNKESASSDSWNDFTDSTFDSGIVISSGNGQYFCIWFEDED